MLRHGSVLNSSELSPVPSWGWSTLLIHCLLRHLGGVHLLAAVSSIAANRYTAVRPRPASPSLGASPEVGLPVVKAFAGFETSREAGFLLSSWVTVR